MHELSAPCMVRSVISERALPGVRGRRTRDEGRSWAMMERQETYLRFGEGELKEERGKGSQLEGKWTATPATLPCAQLTLAALFLLGRLGSCLGTSASRQRGLSIMPQNSNPPKSQVLDHPVLGLRELGPVASPSDAAFTPPSRDVNECSNTESDSDVGKKALFAATMETWTVKWEEQKLASCPSHQ